MDHQAKLPGLALIVTHITYLVYEAQGFCFYKPATSLALSLLGLGGKGISSNDQCSSIIAPTIRCSLLSTRSQPVVWVYLVYHINNGISGE